LKLKLKHVFKKVFRFSKSHRERKRERERDRRERGRERNRERVAATEVSSQQENLWDSRLLGTVEVHFAAKNCDRHTSKIKEIFNNLKNNRSLIKVYFNNLSIKMNCSKNVHQ